VDLTNIKIVGGPLVLASVAEVGKAQDQLWITFPRGYREFVTALGEGVLGGSFVRVYPPWRIVNELSEWRDRIRKYWFWEKGEKVLPKERALESVIVGDTVNGDELIFHPGKPDRLFVLSVEKEQIFEAGSDLLAAVEWMCASGKLTKRFTERNFEPFEDSRKQKKRPVASAGATQSGSKDTLDETVAALQKWVERHGLVKAAQKHFKEWLDKQTEPLIGMDRKVVRKDKVKVKLNEHVLVLPDKYPAPQVLTTLYLVDSETSNYFGQYQLFTALDGTVQTGGAMLSLVQAKALASSYLGWSKQGG